MNIRKENLLSIPEKISLLAKERPDQTAIIAEDRTLTYRNLDELSKKAAYGILSLCPGIKEETPVGLLLDRKSYVFPLEIGIVMAGLAYIPMTDEYPEGRINYCMENAGSKVLVTTRDIFKEKEGLNTSAFRVIFVEEVLSYQGEPLPLPAIRMDRLSHIFYTSGSTGVPKGVRNTVLADAIVTTITVDKRPVYEFFSEGKVCMSVTQISFIASFYDYGALCNGGIVVFADENDFRDMGCLIGKMLNNQVQCFFSTPSFIKNLLSVKQAKPAFAILDTLLMAGEKLDPALVEPLFEINPELHVVNSYAMTESNLATFSKLITTKDLEINIGVPVPGLEAIILDENGNKAGVNDAGEILISGGPVSTGYEKLEEKNRMSFISMGGKIYFKTGDIGYVDETGSFHVSGRGDDMVKYHGQRVELGEIENVIMQADGIEKCKVFMKNNGIEDFLVAFYTSAKELKNKEITEAIKDKLPAYMIPGVFVHLDEMPLNANKKIDRVKLLEMDISFDSGEYEEPETELEARLCEYFAAALGMKRFSAGGDFFDNGGTSLSVSRLLSELGDAGYSASYGDVFENPTPRALAAFIEGSSGKAGIVPMDREEYPLTKTQLGIYLEGITGGNKETYTLQYMMEAEPDIDENQIIAAVNSLYEAHPNLKYMIRCRKNELPYSVFVPDAEVEVPVFEGKKEDRLKFISDYMPVVKVLDNLLFNFAVYKTKECCYLILKAHLIAADATSLSLIISDLNRALNGKALLKEDCCIQQVGIYEEALMHDGTHEKAKEYYLKLFSKMDSIDSLSGDINKPLTPGVSENYRYEPGTLGVSEVRAYCEKNQTSEGAFFMGAMALLLGKYLYADHVSFSTVYNGRSLREMENTIGTLIKRIPVYGDLSENIDVKTYLSGLSKQVFANMSNDIYSFDEVLKECPVNEDVELIFQGDLFTDNMGKGAGEQRIKSDSYFMEHYHTGMVTGCMSIQLFATDGLYNMTIEYRNERFSKEWIRNFADHLYIIARQLLTCEKIGDIVMMSDEDRNQIKAFNDKAVDMEFIPVHEQIRAHTKKAPQKTAVVCNGKALSFNELDLLSSQVAKALEALDVGKEVPVGVLLDRSVYVYVAENGILKAGGAFVPFIPEYPDARIDFCMEDASIPVLLTSKDIIDERNSLLDKDYKVITLEEIFGVSDIAEVKADASFKNFSAFASQKNDLAYCIYTSGSTGRPKGVMIEHGNIANYVNRNPKSVEIMHYAVVSSDL